MRHYEFKSHMDNQVSGLPQPIQLLQVVVEFTTLNE